MFCRKENIALLLLILAQILVLASSQNEVDQIKTIAKTIIASIEVPWIEGLRSVIHSKEDPCTQEIAATLNAIDDQETWALQMLDASAKIQSGIMKGNIRNLGLFDECIEANGNYNGTNIQGQYCTVSNGVISSAVCLPSSCNETQVAELILVFMKNVTKIGNLEFAINRVSCLPIASKNFTFGEIVTMLFFLGFGAFIIFCTICGFVKNHSPAWVSPIVYTLAKFSLHTNAIALLSMNQSPSTMPAINGLRVFTICWVVLGHSYYALTMDRVVNGVDIAEWYDSWAGVGIQTARFAVDTFFVISGFLLSYLFIKHKQSGKRTNFLTMYLHRFIRLTPSLAVFILFIAVLLHRVGNGPLWDGFVQSFIEPCRDNWWLNLLYIQNMFRTDRICILQSWYLAADMQLFWLSPIILYPLHRWPKLGLGILFFFIIGSIIVPGIDFVVNDYRNAPTISDVLNGRFWDKFWWFYVITHNRASSYFMGIFLGYDAATRKRNFNQVTVAIFWIVTCILIILCTLGTRRAYDTSYDWDVVMETAIAILLRPFWSIAVAWIIYACTFGYGGPVTRLLSLPIFIPLSRLSYGIFLVHIMIQEIRSATLQSPQKFSNLMMFNYFWSDMAQAIIASLILSLFFESPIIALEKFFRNHEQVSSTKQKCKTDAEATDNRLMMMAGV